jgi:LmbE family N-acetylglucosaminyl deacetylase
MPQTLAVVVAHPDDDAYSVAGTVALHAEDPGFRFVLVHATCGEGGDIRPGFPATRSTLGEVRRREDDAAWQAVGRPPDRHEWLGHPDGGLASVPPDALVDQLATIFEQEAPDVVVTFGPDGITAHPDHVAIGAAASAAFLRYAGSDRPGFRRLLHAVLAKSVFDRWQRQRTEMDLAVMDPSRVYHGRGVPDELIGVTVDCRAVADRSLAGLLRHESQLHVMADVPVVPDRLRRTLTREWYVVAWPSRPAGSPMLTDVFDGL